MNQSGSGVEDSAHNPPAVVLAALADAELAAWCRQAAFAATLAPRLTLRRFRWRRARLRASRALGTRLLAHAARSGLCNGCHERPATIHFIREEGHAMSSHHYCQICAASVRPGWFAIAESTRTPRPLSKQR